MIPDWQTNMVYFADTLPQKYPQFYEELIQLLDNENVNHRLLPGTNDIWARDYMPVQVRPGHFVQFQYKPDYLKSKAEMASITDVDKVCFELGINPKKSSLVVDGGNVVSSRNKVIMCDKVFRENPTYSKEAVTGMLQEAFEVDTIIFIPTHPEDWTGHADGIVRFLDQEWYTVNDFSKEPDYSGALNDVLWATELHGASAMPYNPYANKGLTSARGIYINYLRMQNLVIVPAFGLGEDKAVRELFEFYCYDPYPHKHPINCKGAVRSLDCNAIAKEGGVLNCISWTTFE